MTTQRKIQCFVGLAVKWILFSMHQRRRDNHAQSNFVIPLVSNLIAIDCLRSVDSIGIAIIDPNIKLRGTDPRPGGLPLETSHSMHWKRISKDQHYPRYWYLHNRTYTHPWLWLGLVQSFQILLEFVSVTKRKKDMGERGWKDKVSKRWERVGAWNTRGGKRMAPKLRLLEHVNNLRKVNSSHESTQADRCPRKMHIERHDHNEWSYIYRSWSMAEACPEVHTSGSRVCWITRYS